MSETKTWSDTKDTTVRTNDNGSGGQGAGQALTLTVGRTGSAGTRRNYDSYLRFTTDWSGVGSIEKAELRVYTAFPFAASQSPHVVVRRLTTNFAEGDSASFAGDNFTAPVATKSGQVSKSMNKALDGLTVIDITAIVKAWAPASAGGSGSVAAANSRNHGIGLFGSIDPGLDWSGYSRQFSDPTRRPTILLTYKLGPTTPDTPTNLSPVGAVAAVGAFQGDFADPRPTDTLAATYVQVYENAGIKSGSVGNAATDIIFVASHGFVYKQEVWFHSLTGGAGLSTGIPYYIRSVTDASHFKVSLTPGGAVVDITDEYSALTVGSPLWSLTKTASETEKINARFNVVPDGLNLLTDTNYKWRARVKDQEARWSLFTAAITFSVTNTDPDAPVITPDDQTYDSLNGVTFRIGSEDDPFSDDDAGDTLLAYQVQLSAQPEGDPDWDDAGFILWDTGKRYVASGSTFSETPYGGRDLAAGTYYWRARVWDNHDGVSDWTYTSIILSEDFDAEPGQEDSIQIDPHAPWRLRIREMNFDSLSATTGAITGSNATDVFTTAKAHGLGVHRKVRFVSKTGGSNIVVGRDYYVISSGLAAKAFKVSETKGGAAVDLGSNVTAAVLSAVVLRGPGKTIGMVENANSLGASKVYNSPGEAHWTLPVDHLQISVMEPKQVHYGIDFYSGDGWREKFAGLLWDADANEVNVVFTGLDYLGLYDVNIDDRKWDPNKPTKLYTAGGTYYKDVTIRTVILDQLAQAKKKANSTVGFITVGSVSAALSEKVTIYSTMQPTLSFIGGLIESHKQGRVQMTRIEVRRVTGGGYEVRVVDNPGVQRDNLRLKYGELVQGYRVIFFGRDWANVQHSIGRQRDGSKVMYETATAPGVDQTVWGRIARAGIVDNVMDTPDLQRRTRQRAIKAGKLGSNIAVTVRTGVLQPFDGYDICDTIPVAIKHGAVNTDAFGSGYWQVLGVGWEAGDDASQTTTLTLLPRNDTASPSSDLIDTEPAVLQAEWQIGWTPPDPLKATSKYWHDDTTGKSYVRDEDTGTLSGVTGTAP